MVTTIIIMSIVIIALFGFILILNDMLRNLTKQLELVDREQHQQNKEIMELMKYKSQHDEMLLQHIEILKYLIEQDPKLNAGKIYYTGPVGEA
jgi:predicted PurR-regulated permease PerM